jgi:hypothetical protein
MRQKVRRSIVLIFLLLFPVTLNYFSLYVSLDGAMTDIISGSLLLFMILFISAIFFRACMVCMGLSDGGAVGGCKIYQS